VVEKVSNLEKMGFTVMTSVQRLSIPVLLEGRDVLIQSQTGSGKVDENLCYLSLLLLDISCVSIHTPSPI